MLCGNPECKRPIADGDRCVTVSVAVNWGDDDIRADHAKQVSFHSFGCVSDYFAEKAADHDGRVLV